MFCLGNKVTSLFRLTVIMKFFSAALFVVSLMGKMTAQSASFPVELAKSMEASGLTLIMPVEDIYKPEKIRKNDFFKYQYRLVAANGQAEVLILVMGEETGFLKSSAPHLAFQRFLPNLAPNDHDQEIMVLSWGDRELQERNADWGAEAYMTARSEITSFEKTKFIAFYKEGQGMVFMAYCFSEPDELPLLLRFSGE